MKIGIDARLIHETGVGRYIQALLSNLPKIDTRNEYVVFVRSNLDKATISKNWQVVNADVGWHTIQEQIQMPKIYRQARLDLLHIPYFSVPIFLNVPFIVTIHDLTISHFATGKATTRSLPIYLLKRLGYFLTMHQAVNRAKTVITVSETVRQQILQEYHLPSAKVRVTYESGEIESTVSTSEKPPISSSYILYAGNAHPHKNVAALIEVYAMLRQEFSDLSLVLVGKQDFFYKELEKLLRKKNLLRGVVFTGEVENRGLVSWYRNATAFIFPSLSEGFGIPGLEAMQLNCPVVASDIEIFHEIYQDGAVYFNPKSKTDMVEKIRTVIGDPLLRQKLINAGKTRTSAFSWDKMARETLNIYESCLGV